MRKKFVLWLAKVLKVELVKPDHVVVKSETLKFQRYESKFIVSRELMMKLGLDRDKGYERYAEYIEDKIQESLHDIAKGMGKDGYIIHTIQKNHSPLMDEYETHGIIVYAGKP